MGCGKEKREGSPESRDTRQTGPSVGADSTRQATLSVQCCRNLQVPTGRLGWQDWGRGLPTLRDQSIGSESLVLALLGKKQIALKPARPCYFWGLPVPAFSYTSTWAPLAALVSWHCLLPVVFPFYCFPCRSEGVIEHEQIHPILDCVCCHVVCIALLLCFKLFASTIA